MGDLEVAACGVGLALVGLALFLLLGAGRLRRQSGLPVGRVISSDMGEGREGKPLYSAKYGLAGTPDYIVETARGPVPVEVKPGRTETEPHESHMLQVLAYCLLIEEGEGQPPPYGLLRYRDETFRVDYNRETRAYLLDIIGRMREDDGGGGPDRSHAIEGRCRACSYREVCDRSLWVEQTHISHPEC